jgi:alanine racemase
MAYDTSTKYIQRPSGLRTWITVDQIALKRNFNNIRKHIGAYPKIYAVAKSNAYGHSLIDFALYMEKVGVDGFCVDSIVEGISLRASKIKAPILVLGATLPERITEACKHNIAITISNKHALHESIKILCKEKDQSKLNVHIKIDTGMHRQGFSAEKIKNILSLVLKNDEYITVQGLYTHFAEAKNPAFIKTTNSQLEQLQNAVVVAQSMGLNPKVHSAATSASLLFPNTRLDIVRIGIGLYGLWPSPETRSALSNILDLTPTLSWKTIITEIKNVKKGERIGYDFTETLFRASKLAVLPVGYWHGYPRALSCIGHVLICGKRAKVIGRVSMDMIVVDITDIKEARTGSIVTLIGQDCKESIFAEELSELSNTVNYEIITRLNPLIKRIYIN